MTYLVDSTVYIDWMRAGLNPVRMLAPWLRSGALAGCGIVRAEVLRGMVATASFRVRLMNVAYELLEGRHQVLITGRVMMPTRRAGCDATPSLQIEQV